MTNCFITKDLNSLQQFDKFIGSNDGALFVLVDENTKEHCYPLLQSILPKHALIQIQSGEENKTLKTCEIIWQVLTKANADRNSLLINLGGGVIGDMGGFAAGCYKRGIKFINIPTTLLAMVDASVGSKTGIDFMGFKNQIGLFNEPEAVFIRTDFLKTLPEREIVSGFAEVLKHYLITDKDSFEQINKNRTAIKDFNWPEIVDKSIKIKSAIVELDPLEKGARKALNFGHTIGHAVESYFLTGKSQKLLHGEAVAIGMITESFLSMKKGTLGSAELEQIIDIILHYFDVPYLPVADLQLMINLIQQDKKNVNQQPQFTLLNGIGNYSINNFVEQGQILESLNYYNSLLE